jgi:N-methylhydantoinase A/oxoprolinase/acetone carboxylase beta subunit
MAFILGIDTGGTYTDSVIVDPSQKKILTQAKAFTTKNDLTIGIANSIGQLHPEVLQKVRLVCLSTTLATNAIVEGRGGKVGLLVSGGAVEGNLPVEAMFRLSGKLDIKGKIKEELDPQEIALAVETLKSHDVDAIAISGFASVRNPTHELTIKTLVQKNLEVPVVCAHELSSSLGFQERTVTAVLNARLIPVIYALIKATKRVLKEKGIVAEIMVVKGDGSLMQESYAMGKPIETILSGPAASIIGGMFLTGTKNALIVDMGGTTTDIANLQNGTVKIRKSGAKVGGWLTQIRAAEICTYGIGGDSYIYADHKGKLSIGPQKVTPLCVAAKYCPHLLDELITITKDPAHELFLEQEIDCFALTGNHTMMEQDIQLAELLKDGPHSALYLARKLEKDVESLNLTRLTSEGLLERISLTPTDILHAMGKYTAWDTGIVHAAIKIIAARMGKTEAEFIQMAFTEIIQKLTRCLLQSIAEFEKESFAFDKDPASMYFFNKAYHPKHQTLMEASYTLNTPVVAVGAPVCAWMQAVCENLHAQLIIPEHSEVANAIGAAAGQVMETAQALIRPQKDYKGYIAHLPDCLKTFETLQEAKDCAIEYLRRYVTDMVKEAGSLQPKIVDATEDVYVQTTGAQKVFVEARLKATAMGSPAWSE